MVVVIDIALYSQREHHLLSFTDRAHVAYTPQEKVLELSKVACIVDMFARCLHIQEQLTQDIADAIQTVTDTEDVGIVTEVCHVWMMMFSRS